MKNLIIDTLKKVLKPLAIALFHFCISKELMSKLADGVIPRNENDVFGYIDNRIIPAGKPNARFRKYMLNFCSNLSLDIANEIEKEVFLYGKKVKKHG